MIEVTIPQGEHKDPKQLIDESIESGENTPLGDQNKIYIPNENKKDANVSHTRKNQKIICKIFLFRTCIFSKILLIFPLSQFQLH